MDLVLLIAILLSAFLALNIGANNSAASMATAYGAGVRTKREATVMIAIFAVLGALLAGAPVVKTLGNGLIPSTIFSAHVGLVLVIFVIAVLFVSWANIARVPVATTHAIVCAIVGVGLYSKSLNGEKFFEIVVWWVITPLVALVLNYLIAKYLYLKTLQFLTGRFSEGSINKILSILITISGVFVAFSAGANNSANSVGPLVGLGLMNANVGAVMAGVAMGVGAMLLGGRVLDSVGKEITEICILRAISVEFIGAAIILVASIFGVPVSLAEIVTSGIIGFSLAQQGFAETAQNRHVVRIAFFWFVIPFVAVAMGYLLSSLYFNYNVSALIISNFGF
ncbi:MAG: inorganic phosphate transporter [Thermodesulfobacteriota bacterium]